ncbi:Uncharacterised protein [[Clostridium] sordellii]|uniref:hypothetical protein n=1 Tax=Paraclostridium sordellii TaxID=1505 RepID=UPI0005E63127|nr:hypothetical protein [Paeniclostridium sordellii]MBS6025725.1 hypothetical protein [Paeniclostridium sordellii]CEN76596.1 Uncharacterised protein [[Clostridium] sordellii] [Paeniclostridium sordellii]CEO10177.1 Uncharacterised protein [[Clostridium] sordellii] [Paeniclostridium sordellii]
MKKRNGSVVVTSLLCFSILSCIFIGCLEIINSNLEIVNTYEIALKLRHDVKSGINLGYSKILEEVNKAIIIAKEYENQNEKYKEYFIGSNKIEFIKSIEDINIDEISLDIVNNKVYIEDNYIRLDIVSKKTEGELEKGARCSFKINLDFNQENIKNIVEKYDYKEI